MLLKIFKVSGHSMLPTFAPNDRIIATSLVYKIIHPKVNDIIIFKNEKKLIIKRIAKINNKQFYVDGDNKKDTLSVGWIKRQDIIGKVILKI